MYNVFYLSVRSFVHSFITKFVNMILMKIGTRGPWKGVVVVVSGMQLTIV